MNKDDEIVIESIRSSEIKPTDEKDLRCAPSKKFENGSCIPLRVLVEMARAYNEENPNNQIRLSSTHETLSPHKYKRYLVKQFRKKLNSVCDNQKCWVKQNFMKRLESKMKEDVNQNTFRPGGPEGKFTWLNTTNIDDVMKQYESKYPDFKYLGTVPIDFDKININNIKNLDFNKDLLDKGKSRIGMVFNLDEHDQDGSHWVALYADLNKGLVYFSDSYGIEPENRIRIFMTRIATFIKNKLNKKPVVDYNRTKHQRGSSECGVFSINFILRLLKGETFEEITGKRISDESVNECRQFYFT